MELKGTITTIHPPEGGKEQQVTTQTPLGALFRPIHMERPMKVFPIHESEVSGLSLLNNLVTGFWSGASGLLLLAIGLIIDLAVEGQLISGQLTESGRVLLLCVTPLCGLIAFALFIAGWLAKGKRASIWRRIEEESIEIPQ